MSEPVCWRILEDGAHEPAENMARDEAMLQLAPEIGSPILRTYQWARPAATFGYGQAIGSIKQSTEVRPLIRRSTGGGLVIHQSGWTYSFVAPHGEGWTRLRGEESYRLMHRWIAAAFGFLGIHATLTDSAPPADLSRHECFRRPERHDLLCDGRKLAGAAQRRSRKGLLIQGAIQNPPAEADPQAWLRAMMETGAAIFNLSWSPYAPTPAFNQLATELVNSRFGNPAYLEKR